jgi:flagellar assembly protein FliH
MPTIIRAADQPDASRVAFNFDDMAERARQYLAEVRAEAAEIVAKARHEAAAIRKQAQEDGRQAAMLSVEQMVHKQLATVLPALRQATGDINLAKQAWLAHWEATGLHVAAAIARRVIRRELSAVPEITIGWIREALELAAGSTQVRLHLNPADHQALGHQVRMLTSEMAGLGEVQVLADAAVTPGGCRVETRFGTIDQQLDAQLARLEEELTQT